MTEEEDKKKAEEEAKKVEEAKKAEEEKKATEAKAQEEKKYPTFDEVKKLLDESLKQLQKDNPPKETATKTTTEIKGKNLTDEGGDLAEPTGSRIELNFKNKKYIIQPPSDWDDLDKTKLKIMIEDAIKRNDPAFYLDKAIKVIEMPIE